MAEILERIEHVLGERFKLSSLNVRTADPLTGWVQPLHADVGAIADEKGYWVANTVWMLDDFTTDNGALRVVPGSQRLRKLPQQALKDPSAPHSDEVLVTGKAGTVIVMNSHMWHGGTANRTAKPRCALHAFYARWDKPQQQYQKRLLAPALQARLSPELRQLLALDDPLNDRLCSEVTSQSGFLRQSLRASPESERARTRPLQLSYNPYSFFQFCRLGVDKGQECPLGDLRLVNPGTFAQGQVNCIDEFGDLACLSNPKQI